MVVGKSSTENATFCFGFFSHEKERLKIRVLKMKEGLELEPPCEMREL